MVYSVQAQDLLQGISALSPDEVSQLNRFHDAMSETIRAMSNEDFVHSITGKTNGDETYNNQFACHLTALIAIARYQGDQQQTIEMATAYYACFGKQPGFKNTVTADNAKSCSDFQQYIGKVVAGVENSVVIGAYRFPENLAITEAEGAAKEVLLHDAIDTALYGRWRQ